MLHRPKGKSDEEVRRILRTGQVPLGVDIKSIQDPVLRFRTSMRQNQESYTCFGRNYEIMQHAEELLPTIQGSEPKVLVVGPGLAPSPEVTRSVKGIPWTEGLYCPEPLEVASMLMRDGRDWKISVLDYDDALLDIVKHQNIVPVSDYFPDVPTEYQKSFLPGAERTPVPKLDINHINQQDNPHQVSQIDLVEIPQNVKDRLSFVGADITEPGLEILGGKFDMIIFAGLHNWIGSETALGNIARMLRPGGYLVATEVQDEAKNLQDLGFDPRPVHEKIV
ncbi:class I SAM-dependent methyltransferase, partial [Candidatus Altiarchaeota archaeon]